MSVSAIQGGQQVSQAEAVSQAQSAQKQASQISARSQNSIPQDRVTISEAAQAKQTASSIGADPTTS